MSSGSAFPFSSALSIVADLAQTSADAQANAASSATMNTQVHVSTISTRVSLIGHAALVSVLQSQEARYACGDAGNDTLKSLIDDYELYAAADDASGDIDATIVGLQSAFGSDTLTIQNACDGPGLMTAGSELEYTGQSDSQPTGLVNTQSFYNDVATDTCDATDADDGKDHQLFFTSSAPLFY